MICISQAWNPVKRPNKKDVSDKRKVARSANAMLRSQTILDIYLCCCC